MNSFDLLSIQQQEMYRLFQDITNIENAEIIIRALESANWNLEEAVLTQTSDSNGGNGDGLIFNNHEEVPEIPQECQDFAALPSETSTYMESIGTFSTNAEYIQQSNEAFVNRFQALHILADEDKILPEFFIGTLSEAIKHAFTVKKRALLFYIDNQNSQNSESFAENILSNHIVSSVINNQFVLFLWDASTLINTNNLIHNLDCSNMQCVRVKMENMQDCTHAFPILVAVVPNKDSYSILEYFEGSESLEEVISRTLEGAEMYNITENINATKRAERDALREEQQKAYQESLEADLKKEEERKMLKQQKEEKEKEEIEQEKTEELKKLNEAKRQEDLRMTLPSEPEETDDSIVTVKFKFPNRIEKTRRFRKSETIRTLVDYLSSEGWTKQQFNFINSDRRNVVETFGFDKTFAELVEKNEWTAREQINVAHI